MTLPPLFGCKVLPELVVFDLDYTIWPLWVDTHVEPPFSKLQDGRIIDRDQNVVTLYSDVTAILEELKSRNVKIAVASRTGAIDVAEKLLEIMELNDYFVAKEIYPGSKVTHFSRFKENLDIDYCEMIFFDDEDRNIRDLTKVGVIAIHTPTGLSWKYLQHGLKMFCSRK